jgi:hypothetical protein
MSRILVVIFLTSLISCQLDHSPNEVTRSFYYWKGNYRWSPWVQKTCTELGVQRLYLRFFEIRPNNIGLPVFAAPVKIDFAGMPAQVEVFPTIFVFQSLFHKLSPEANKALAENTIATIRQQAAGRAFHALQIDCDWTQRSKVGYFEFLRNLKTALPGVELSATIRLHQITYRSETGIPPVDRGMLMLYNLSDPTQYQTANSIFDAQEAKRYLRRQSVYPKPLDLALPLFSWGLQFRGGRFQGFLRDQNRETLDALTFLAHTSQKNIYRVKVDTVFQDLYLRPGDRVRLESVSNQDLEKAIDLAKGVFPPQDTRALAFFQLDSFTLASFSHEHLEKIFYRLHP